MRRFAASSDSLLNVIAIGSVVAAAALFLYTRRLEFLAVMMIPAAGWMLTNFRAATAITTWVMLIWLSRLPAVLFDFVLLSYVVYGCLGLTMIVYLLRAASAGQSRIPIIANLWIVLFVVTIVVAGIRGMLNVDGIPAWILTTDSADYSTPWIYFRTVVFPALFLPLLAILIAAAVRDRQKLSTVVMPIAALAWTIALLILKEAITSGQSLLTMALSDERAEYLTNLGFHSNEFGTLLAIMYALLIGAHEGAPSGRIKKMLAATLLIVATALILTLSRGAYMAFAATNILFFMRMSPRRKALAITAVLLLWFALPAAVFNRAQYGLDSKDANEISAGRVENIWAPLLPDVSSHLLFGQGLHSILWTDAQRFQEIYPVGLAHNAYLDLLLDLGVIGALPVLAWYAYIWRGFLRQSKFDGDPAFRGFFYGGHLAMVSLALCCLTNDRLTPTANTAFIWVAAGVLLGRQYLQQQSGLAPLRTESAVITAPRAVARRAIWT